MAAIPFVIISTPLVASDGNNVKIQTQSGEAIRGVRKLTINMALGDVVTATLELVAVFVGAAQATFVVADPLTGSLKKVRRIEFDDDTVFEWEATESPSQAQRFPPEEICPIFAVPPQAIGLALESAQTESRIALQTEAAQVDPQTPPSLAETNLPPNETPNP